MAGSPALYDQFVETVGTSTRPTHIALHMQPIGLNTEKHSTQYVLNTEYELALKVSPVTGSLAKL